MNKKRGAQLDLLQLDRAAAAAEEIRSLILGKNGDELHAWLPSKASVTEITRIIFRHTRGGHDA